MNAILFTILGSAGVFLIYTRVAFGWTSLRRARISVAHRRTLTSDWLVQAGLQDVCRREFAIVCVSLYVITFLITLAVFGGIVPALLGALFAASWPLLAYRQRRSSRIASAQRHGPG